VLLWEMQVSYFKLLLRSCHWKMTSSAATFKSFIRLYIAFFCIYCSFILLRSFWKLAGTCSSQNVSFQHIYETLLVCIILICLQFIFEGKTPVCSLIIHFSLHSHIVLENRIFKYFSGFFYLREKFLFYS
jgi:uncharacterized membrane protein (DUF485 family)